jgi:broad specificity phosphatase PhoE
MQDNNKNYCTLYIVRHGQTEWNVDSIIQGQKDSALTKKGVVQAEATAQKLKNIKFDAIFSSDLSRAQRTAEIIKLDRDLAVQTSHLLRERSFGHYEGMAAAEYEVVTRHLLEKLQSLSEEESWNFKFGDDVESDQELLDRFLIKLREIAVAFSGKIVLVVTHGGGIRNFLMKMGYANYGDLPAGSFENSGYVKVLSDGLDFFIKEVEGIVKN